MEDVKDLVDRIELIVKEDPGARNISSLWIEGELWNSVNAILNKDRIGIVTGFPCLVDFSPPTETDGPPGAFYLAHCLHKIGKSVTLISDSPNAQVMEAGFNYWFGEAEREERCGGSLKISSVNNANLALVELSPSDAHAQVCEELLQMVDFLVAIERSGPSLADNKCRSMRGIDLSMHCADLHLLFERAAEFHVGTIGIGDGGNEIGMGKVVEKVIESIRNGPAIACRIATDFLIVCGVSNWGGYALGATSLLLAAAQKLIAIEKVLEFLPEAQEEFNALVIQVEAGARDGISSSSEPSVDGMPFDTQHKSIINRIRETVEEYKGSIE